jgi:hypothetical protein
VSGRQAKAERRAERAAAERQQIIEIVAQAHDRLHKNDVDACHELLHAALGSGEMDPSGVAPLAHLAIFDDEFRKLCLRLGAKASYVLEDPAQEGRLVSGGHAGLDRLVTDSVREHIEREP